MIPYLQALARQAVPRPKSVPTGRLHCEPFGVLGRFYPAEPGFEPWTSCAALMHADQAKVQLECITAALPAPVTCSVRVPLLSLLLPIPGECY
jgi:hypothetical protein